MARSSKDIPKDYQDKLNAWKDSLKKQWDYNRKLMVFEGSDGQVIYYTTTSTTTTTTAPPTPNVTTPTNTSTSTFSQVVTIDTSTKSGGASTDVAGADTSQLITIVGITCGSLLALLIILLVFIRLCRRAPGKRKERISLRRPLNPPEPEEHIYAEIEPLQRSASPGGASGNSGDVPLPSKKNRKRGVSSFRAMSTRIFRFFSAEQAADNQSVFYNRNDQQAVVPPPPEPPTRNKSPKRKRGPGVKRFESTASRRALLDGDSQISNSSGVEMRPPSTSSEGRNNIYNPLLRESDNRVSGPYDHLTLAQRESGQGAEGAEGDVETPHDYFTLEKNTMNASPRLPGRGNTLSPVREANSEDTTNPLDSMLIENETSAAGESKEEPRVASTHDYFVLEPHEKEASKNSVKSNKSPTKDLTNGSVHKSPRQSPVKESNDRPVAKPRGTKSVSPTKSNPGSPTSDEDIKVEIVNGGENKTDNSMDDANYIDPAEALIEDMMDDANYIDPMAKKPKDDIYVLSKLGTAPEPPMKGPIQVDEDYLSPLEVRKQDEYMDVYPNPPPRTSSLNPEDHGGSSPKKHPQPPKTSLNPEEHGGSSPKKHPPPPKQLSHESTV